MTKESQIFEGLRILKRPELVKDLRFNNPIKRFKHVEFLDEIIENWTSTKTREEAIDAFEAVRIPCGKTLTMSEVQNHPNLKERGMLIDHFDFSLWNVDKASIPGPLIRFSETKGIGPEFRQNKEETFCGLLGIDKEQS